MSDYITSNHVATTDEMRKAYMGSGSDAAPKHLVFNRWLESMRAEERERIARNIEEVRVVRSLSDGWNYGMEDAARIAREGA